MTLSTQPARSRKLLKKTTKTRKNAPGSHDCTAPELTTRHKALFLITGSVWGSATQILKAEQIPDPSLCLNLIYNSMRRLKTLNMFTNETVVCRCKTQICQTGSACRALVLLQSHWRRRRLQAFGKLLKQLTLKIHGPLCGLIGLFLLNPLGQKNVKMQYGCMKKKGRWTACYM